MTKQSIAQEIKEIEARIERLSHLVEDRTIESIIVTLNDLADLEQDDKVAEGIRKAIATIQQGE